MTAAAYVPHRYSPDRPEIGAVADAIVMFKQALTDHQAPDVHVRANIAYCEGVANAMASMQDYFKSELGKAVGGGPADERLWADIAAGHPWHRSGGFALKRVWFDYIRTAAEHQVQS